MSITLKFGLPGCGKTTLMVHDAIMGIKTKRYENVYCNVPISVPGVTHIDNACIGKYNLHDGLILIDEATIFADSREFKSFSKDKVEYFLLHRHFNVDIILYCQQWDAVDRKIRTITDRVYYVYKGFWTGHWITNYYRIPYGIIIPDPNKANGGEKLGDIVQGYAKPNIFVRLCCTKRVYRPLYYKYFDSWEKPPRPELPDKYHTYTHCEFADKEKVDADRREQRKRAILLCLKDTALSPFLTLKNKIASLSDPDSDPAVPIAE